eukprot:4310208-Amphidinium_carterae.1
MKKESQTGRLGALMHLKCITFKLMASLMAETKGFTSRMSYRYFVHPSRNNSTLLREQQTKQEGDRQEKR